MNKESYHQIPVVINNRNRLAPLVALVQWLERAGMNRIFILDNASTYPPLLDFYRLCRHSVIHLPENVGFLALWETAVWHEFSDDYYVYTDADVVPEDACPTDLVRHLFEVLKQYPGIEKVGPALRIDDIPDTNRLKAEIQAAEGLYWRKPVAPGVFDAKIDTTFALYRPYARGGHWIKAFRTGDPYVAKHTPWYIDSNHLEPEEIYYREHSQTQTYWTVRA